MMWGYKPERDMTLLKNRNGLPQVMSAGDILNPVNKPRFRALTRAQVRLLEHLHEKSDCLCGRRIDWHFGAGSRYVGDHEFDQLFELTDRLQGVDHQRIEKLIWNFRYNRNFEVTDPLDVLLVYLMEALVEKKFLWELCEEELMKEVK